MAVAIDRWLARSKPVLASVRLRSTSEVSSEAGTTLGSRASSPRDLPPVETVHEHANPGIARNATEPTSSRASDVGLAADTSRGSLVDDQYEIVTMPAPTL